MPRAVEIGRAVPSVILVGLLTACGVGAGADSNPINTDEVSKFSSSFQISNSLPGDPGVRVSAPLQTAQAGSAKPWFVEDFESYGKVSGDPSRDFRKNSNGWWTKKFTGGWARLHTIENDPPLGQVWRVNQAGPVVRTPKNCKPGAGMGRDLKLPNPEKEIWVEMWVRFSPTYKTNWYVECNYGRVETGGHKFIFWHRINSREGSTWRFKVGSNGRDIRAKAANQQYEDSKSHGTLPNACFNDRWQRWRFHLRAASVQGKADGYYEWRWVDMDDPSKIVFNRCSGESMEIIAATPTDQHDGFDALELGKTFNDGPTAEQWWEFGEIRVWRDNPDWGW